MFKEGAEKRSGVGTSRNRQCNGSGLFTVQSRLVGVVPEGKADEDHQGRNDFDHFAHSDWQHQP
ncbi:MAG: hypothetical protein R3E68_01710 [Burkholderiaceae bacterium]